MICKTPVDFDQEMLHEIDRIFLFLFRRTESDRKMLNPETGCYSESVRAWWVKQSDQKKKNRKKKKSALGG